MSADQPELADRPDPADRPDRADKAPAVPGASGLYAPVDGAFHRIAKMTANVFEAPIATVSILGDDRVWFPAAEGLGEMTEAPIEPALVAEIRRQSGPFVVEEAANDPRTQAHPVVRGHFGVRFYAAAPIVLADGEVLGALEVMDKKRRRRVTEAQLGLLSDLAETVAQLLQIRVSALNALRTEQTERAADNDRRLLEDRRAAQRSQAETAARDRERPEWCQLGGAAGCEASAEMKVADSWGDSAWGCWTHAEDALMQIPSVFLATESPVGLKAYRDRGPRS
jgi:hypothetical protein